MPSEASRNALHSYIESFHITAAASCLPFAVMAGFNVAALFAVELPAWLSAMLQGQGMQPAERAAAPA